MSEDTFGAFHVGQRVEVHRDNDVVVGTITGFYNDLIDVQHDEGGLGSYFGWRLAEVSEPEPEYVHVIESRQIWITLPGDAAGHRLSEEQAKTLFRQLEEIL